MIRAVVVFVSLVLAALCWLALDDITTGSQPGYRLEWTVVAVTAGWFAALAWWWRERGRAPHTRAPGSGAP